MERTTRSYGSVEQRSTHPASPRSFPLYNDTITNHSHPIPPTTYLQHSGDSHNHTYCDTEEARLAEQVSKATYEDELNMRDDIRLAQQVSKAAHEEELSKQQEILLAEQEETRQAEQNSKASHDEELHLQEDRAFILDKLGKFFPDLEPEVVTSILLNADNAATASDILREIQEGKDAACATPRQVSTRPREVPLQKQQEQETLRQQLDLSQATLRELLEDELPDLMHQLSRSQAMIQDLLEREFPRLDTKVVAVTLRDNDNDVAKSREALRSLSDY